MIAPRITLRSIPEAYWQRPTEVDLKVVDLYTLVGDALSIERRLAKGVGVDNERLRYDLCCAQIEAFAKGLAGQVVEDPEGVEWNDDEPPAISLKDDYLPRYSQLIKRSKDGVLPGRLGASFFPPDHLASYLSILRQLTDEAARERLDTSFLSPKMNFLAEAIARRWGVIQIQDSFCIGDAHESHDPELDEMVWNHDHGSEPTETDEEHEGVDEVLRKQLAAASRDAAQAVNFTNQPHRVITNVLREFAYSTDGSGPAARVRVVYNDGSEAAPFPIRCLEEKSNATVLPEGSLLHVALISMRHLGLDKDADMAWFRNRGASQNRTLGEADNFCFDRSAQQFRELRRSGPVELELLQTGFQPGILGFFRALVLELGERNGDPPLKVVPVYYSRRGIKTGRGTPWQ